MKLYYFLKDGYEASELGYINRVLTLLIIAMLAFALTGCDTMKKKEPEAAVPPPTKTVNIDKALLQECGDIPNIQNPVTDQQLNDWIQRWAKIHIECATNKRKLNAEVKKALNISD